MGNPEFDSQNMNLLKIKNLQTWRIESMPVGSRECLRDHYTMIDIATPLHEYKNPGTQEQLT